MAMAKPPTGLLAGRSLDSSKIVEINGLEIAFPFEPYDVQKALMSKVLDCIDKCENGLLESPTGTGKTLSLLCSAAAWQNKQKQERHHELVKLRMSSSSGLYRKPQSSDNVKPEGLNGVPIIIYASRTHSQLSQAVRELKRSSYRTSKAIVLGSRDLMCVHEEVTRLRVSSAKITACHAKVHSHTCVYYNNVGKRVDDPNLREPPVVDIEDIVKKGKSGRFCPFYMSRELVKQSDIVFMPYNYLLDPKLRSSHGIDLSNSIIILDEGHNIAKLCEEAVSFELRSSLIASCIQEITYVSVEYNDSLKNNDTDGNPLIPDLSLSQLLQLKKSFLDLEEKLDAVTFDTGPDALTPIDDLLDPLQRAGFNRHSMPRIIKDLDAISTYLSGNNKDSAGCDKFVSALRVLCSRTTSDIKFAQSYKVSVKLEDTKPEKGSFSGNKPQAKVFQFWCFNPAIGLDTLMLQNPRCIILSSGTLSPIPFLVKELQTPFPVQLSNPHIISNNQLFAAVFNQGPRNARLSSTFDNRNDPKYLFDLGELIITVCRLVPKGVLVFFPSYAVLEICTQSWEASGVWADLNHHKKVLVEPRRKDAFSEIMEAYYTHVSNGSGACLMAVCRGKVSEGLDFADDNGRAVIITGIPYAPARDLRVIAKKKYLDQQLYTDPKTANERVSGNMWYQLEAYRALNQAIGRIIRHAHDYGAILLCDERCDGSQFQDNLSGWVRSRLQPVKSYTETMHDLARFFGTEVQKARDDAYRASPIKPSAFNRNPGVRRRNIYLGSVSEEDLDLDNEIERVTTKRSTVKNADKPEASTSAKSQASQRVKPGATNGAKQESSQDDKLFKRPPPPKAPVRSLLGSLDRDRQPTSISQIGFNSPIPVFAKSFAAFSKPAVSDEDSTQKRKKIRLVTSTDSKFKAPSPPPSPSPRRVSVTKFWDWVLDNVSPGKSGTFREAIKDFHATKNLENLSVKIRLCFDESKIEGCVEGFGTHILSAVDTQRLKTHMEKMKD